MKKGQRLLEALLRKDHISGFNRPFSAYDFSETSILVLSNLHETIPYREAVLKDLKAYADICVDVHKKIGFTRWRPDYRIRDDKGDLFPGIKIKDKQKYLKLEDIQSGTLREAGFATEYIRTLIGINNAYEIRIESPNHNTVQCLAKMFIDRTNSLSLEPWPDDYDIPVIFLLGAETMPDFLPVTMYQQRRRRDSLNFVQKKLAQEIEKQLEGNGFEKAYCLANSLFVERCCNQ